VTVPNSIKILSDKKNKNISSRKLSNELGEIVTTENTNKNISSRKLSNELGEIVTTENTRENTRSNLRKKTKFKDYLNTQFENTNLYTNKNTNTTLVQVIEKEEMENHNKTNNLFLTGINDENNKNIFNDRVSNLMNRINKQTSKNSLPNIITNNSNDNYKYNKNSLINSSDLIIDNSKLFVKNNFSNIYNNNLYDNKSYLSPLNNYLSSINNQSTEASVNNNIFSTKINLENQSNINRLNIINENSIGLINNINNISYSFPNNSNIQNQNHNFLGRNILSQISHIQKKDEFNTEPSYIPNTNKRKKNEKKSYYNIIDSITKDLDSNLLSRINITENNLNESNLKALISPRNNKLNISSSINQNNYKNEEFQTKDKSLIKKDLLDFKKNDNTNEGSSNILSKENINNSNFLEKANINSSNFIIPEDYLSNQDNSLKKNHNNSQNKKIPKSSNYFIEKFKYRCDSELENYTNIINEIKYDILTSPKFDKNKLDIFNKRDMDEKSKAIDKDLYFMDGNNEQRDKVLMLLGEEGKDKKKKFLYENKKSPLSVGDFISKINEKFAFNCRTLLFNEFIEGNNAKKEKINEKELDEIKEKQILLDLKHKNIEFIVLDTENKRYLSQKRINNIMEFIKKS
jgi:hypothetical protein